MTVYVGDMRGKYGRLIMCHMIADTDAELHGMADKIRVARKWHQGDHYDIALSKRALAIGYGAVELPMRILAIMATERRKSGRLPGVEEVAGIQASRIAAMRDRSSIAAPTV